MECFRRWQSVLAYTWVYAQSVSIKQARKKRGGGKGSFLALLQGAHLRSREMWLKGQKVNLRLISFSGIFCAVCVCGPEWCLKTVLITLFIIVIYLCGEISHLQEYLKLCKEYSSRSFLPS